LGDEFVHKSVDKQKHNEKYCQKMVLHMVDVRLYDGLSGKRRITATQTPQQQKNYDRHP